MDFEIYSLNLKSYKWIMTLNIPVKTLVNDNNYKITGFPFFNRAERQSQFNEAMTNLLVAE